MTTPEDAYAQFNTLDIPEEVRCAAQTIVRCVYARERRITALWDLPKPGDEGTLFFVNNSEVPVAQIIEISAEDPDRRVYPATQDQLDEEIAKQRPKIVW